MVSANASIVPPPGYTSEALAAWSYACATGQHDACRGRRLNPDPDCDPDDIWLPCDCPIDGHHDGQAKRGRPRKTPVD
ncbi:hypothetical protein GCM10010412_082200 [Nonomuraea recticatena]|uniref:Uncharacterized protein n=1 Tax=Nonomuraea recticatena TaxID=46178 RepID=A0ABP6FH70_9ACTN